MKIKAKPMKIPNAVAIHPKDAKREKIAGNDNHKDLVWGHCLHLAKMFMHPQNVKPFHQNGGF